MPFSQKKNLPPKAPPAPEDQNSTPADQEKKKIFIGLFFVVLSFLGAIVIFYLVMDMIRTREKEVDKIKASMRTLSHEKRLADTKISALKEEVPELGEIVKSAEKIYGDQEKSRKEGFLWIDRQGRVMIITLGALNGLKSGNRLAVYDGKKRVGDVQVDLPIDVISYALPADDMTIQDFKKDYYRVAIE